jgi:hypothetical protein
MGDETRTESTRGLREALYAVLIVGLVLALGSGALGSLRWALTVGSGALLAAVNLWALGCVVRGLLWSGRSRAAWALLAVLKFSVLVVGCYWLLTAGVVELLPLAVGYDALPLGIVITQLTVRFSPEQEG